MSRETAGVGVLIARAREEESPHNILCEVKTGIERACSTAVRDLFFLFFFIDPSLLTASSLNSYRRNKTG